MYIKNLPKFEQALMLTEGPNLFGLCLLAISNVVLEE